MRGIARLRFQRLRGAGLERKVGEDRQGEDEKEWEVGYRYMLRSLKTGHMEELQQVGKSNPGVHNGVIIFAVVCQVL